MHTAELWCSNPIRYGFVAWAIAIHTRDFAQLQEHAPGTLGATVFSWAVSSFCLVSSTREETSATQGSSRGTFREQSSSVCTNDFMGILHPWEQHFHPAKCSTVFNRLNVWEQAPGTNWANLKTLPRVYWHMQNEPGACVGSKTPCALKVGQWNERVRAKTCDAVDWDSA